MPRVRVLFLCVHNAARSQLAEALLRQIADDGIDVHSAGSEPTRVNPFALRVLQDRDIDTSRLYSKSVTQFHGETFDYVITLCDEEECPIFPGPVTCLHWATPDPSVVSGDSETKLEAFRQTAKALEMRLTEFARTLLVGTTL